MNTEHSSQKSESAGLALVWAAGITFTILSILLFTGCATTQHCDPASPDYAACVAAAQRAEVQGWADDLEIIARDAVPLVLEKNPDERPVFERVVSELKRAEASPTISLETIRQILEDAKIKEIKAPEARAAITAGRLVIRRWIRRELEINNPEHARLIAGGLRQGIEDGLAVLGAPPEQD